MTASRIAALLLAACLPLSAQEAPEVAVEARLEPATVMVGEVVELRITVRTGGERVERWATPTIPAGLTVVSTGDQSQAQFSLPGGRSLTQTRVYSLVPTRAGAFLIPAITLRVDGRGYRTEPQLLSVTDAAPAAGATPRSELRARFVPDTVYVGQQSTLVTEASFAGDLRMRMSWAPEYYPPNPEDFWIEELEDGAAVRTRVTGSRILSEVYSYRRAYFPLRPARFTLDPVRLVFDVRAGRFGQTAARERLSDSLRLVVRPLPAAGRPTTFRGAVGEFAIEAMLGPDTVPAGESAVLTLTVEGTGNVRTLAPPTLATLEGLRVFPPSEDARMVERNGRVGGIKTFRWVLAPERPGRFPIGPVVFAYFDPRRAEYRELRTAPLVLTATSGRTVAGASTTLPVLRTQRMSDALGWVRSSWFAAAQLVPLLVFGLLAAVGRRRRRGGGPSRRSLARDRRRRLIALRPRAESEDPTLYSELEAVVAGVLGDHGVVRPGTAPSAQGARAALLSHRVDPALADRVAAWLAAVVAARYAPEGATEAQRTALVDEAAELVRALELALGRRPKRGSAHGALLVALALPTLAAGPDAFGDGLGLYEAGRTAEARVAFRRATAEQPYDGAAWHNLALTAWHEGDRGAAIHGWLRALALDPRDPAARRALGLAGAPGWLIEDATPALPLRDEETLLLATLLWWLGWGLIAARQVGWKRQTLPAGAALLSLAALTASTVAVPGLLPDRAVILPASVELRAAPDTRAEALLRLEGGAGVIVRDRVGAWLRVVTQDGREAWVERRDVGTL